jgi:16S rRNA processing protein RimM
VRVVVGRIGRPHGIRGQVTVEPRTDEPDQRFAPGSRLLIANTDDVLVVSAMHWHSGRLLLAIEGVDDRNGAEALRDTIVEVDRDPLELPEEPGEYFDSQLVGCQVFDAAGLNLGEVTDVVHLPNQDLLSVTSASGREFMIPFIEQFVPEVDIAAQRISVTPPPGLLDE